MAVIDDLVSSGLSGTQATEVIAVGAGTGSDAALVSQGFSTTQATQILAVYAGDATDVELVQQGLSGTQATAIVEAVGEGPTPPVPSEIYTYSFNGNTQGVKYPLSANLEFGSNDFTIEFYMNPSASQAPYATITDSTTNNSGTYVGIGQNNNGESGKVSFRADNNVSTIVASTSYSSGTRQHVACVRSGSNGYIFINGVLQASTTSWSGATNAFLSEGALGRSNFGGGGGNDNTYTGYLDNFRVTERALYTAGFTPPAAPLAVVADTMLLTLQDATVVDNSPNALTLTALSSFPTASIYVEQTTYTQGTQYGNGALQLNTMGATTLDTTDAYWIPGGTELGTLTSQPSGTAYTFERMGTTYTFTTTGAWTSGAGTHSVAGTLSPGGFPGGPPYNVPAITFAPA